MQFVDVVSVIERVFTEIGDKVFSDKDERRKNAYKAAWTLASNDNVKLDVI